MFIVRAAYKKASTNLLLKAAFILVSGDTKPHLVLHVNILLGFACSIQGAGTYVYFKMPKLQILRTGLVLS